MSLRMNADGQVESIKTVVRQHEHVTVIESREELVEALGVAQAIVNEITQDLAEYDALVAPSAPSAPAAPDPNAGGAQ